MNKPISIKPRLYSDLNLAEILKISKFAARPGSKWRDNMLSVPGIWLKYVHWPY